MTVMSGVARHLVTVWNPSYAADAMDEHLRILLEWSARARTGAAEADDVYVWWARLRSPNRMNPLPHLGDVMRLQEQQGTRHLAVTHTQSSSPNGRRAEHTCRAPDDR